MTSAEGHGEAVAAFVLSAPRNRVCDPIPQITDDLIQTAIQISRRLGYITANVMVTVGA